MASRSDIGGLLDEACAAMVRRHIASAVLFGSFARNCAHDTSDIDIAVWPADEWVVSDWDGLMDDLEALPTLKKWDVVRMTGFVSPTVRGMIERDGIVLF